MTTSESTDARIKAMDAVVEKREAADNQCELWGRTSFTCERAVRDAREAAADLDDKIRTFKTAYAAAEDQILKAQRACATLAGYASVQGVTLEHQDACLTFRSYMRVRPASAPPLDIQTICKALKFSDSECAACLASR